MSKFNFEVNKEVSFVYWLQTLVEWSPSFQRGANEYYLRKLGALSPEEAEALSLMKNFLKRKDLGYLWLWDLYVGKKSGSAEDLEIWNKIKNIFSTKFNPIWDDEQNKLIEWKKILEDYEPENMGVEMDKIGSFFDVEPGARTYNIQLVMHWNNALPSGHTHRNYKDNIILPISSVEHEEIGRVWGVILHEAIHHFGYESAVFESRLIGAYKKYIGPTRLMVPGQSWKSLLSETVISSIAGKRFNNYLGEKLAISSKEKNDLKSDLAELDDFIFSQNSKNSGFLIRKAASLIYPETKTYLDSGMVMDLAYAKKVANVWLKMCEVGFIKRLAGRAARFLRMS